MASIAAVTNGEAGASVRTKINAAITEANRVDAVAAAAFPDDVLVVRTVDDLPDVTGDEHILPAKTVLLAANINLGANALRLSTGTLLRGLGGQMITSSNASGVIRATNLTAPVVMREFLVTATAGPALALTGDIAHQLNCFFLGIFGAAAGTISGYDVQAFKDCFFNTADGLTLDGTTNKIFLSQCPWYGMTAGNAAVTFAAGLNARRVHIDSPFFKADAASICLRAETGYTVGYGTVESPMVEGPTQILDGITPADPNWWFRGSPSIRDSRVAAQATLDAQTTTTITTLGQYVHIAGAFTLAPLSQRLTLDVYNDLEYAGEAGPALITVSASVTLDPANNVRVGLLITQNGSPITASQSYIEQGTGGSNQPRPGSTTALIEIDPGDIVGLSIANLTDTSDIDVLSATYTVISG